MKKAHFHFGQYLFNISFSSLPFHKLDQCVLFSFSLYKISSYYMVKIISSFCWFYIYHRKGLSLQSTAVDCVPLVLGFISFEFFLLFQSVARVTHLHAVHDHRN